MTKNKITGLLGIAAKGGNVSSGELAATEQIRAGRAKLVLIARDASDNTKDRFVSMCRGHKAPACSWQTKEELGRSIGKAERSVRVITDRGLADKIAQLLLNESEAEFYGERER